jgi:hypothetical protein
VRAVGDRAFPALFPRRRRASLGIANQPSPERLAGGSQRTRSVSGGRKSLADQRHDLVGLRIAPEHRLGEHELAVHVHVEDAVRPRDDLDDADDVLPLLEDARRQTGSVGPRPSGDAVLDPDVVALDHRFDSTTRRPPSVAAPGRSARCGRPCHTNPTDSPADRLPRPAPAAE